MHIFAFLTTLLFAAGHAQGAALHAKALRDGGNAPATPDVSVKAVAANGTLVDLKPAVASTQSQFNPTPETQSICFRSDQTGAMTGDFARSDDCNQLASLLQNHMLGYWDTWDYQSAALQIIYNGTCAVYISSVDTFNEHIWIGSQDIADAIGLVVSEYTKDGLVAAAGQMNCNHPNGATKLDWSVQDSYKTQEKPT
ncbi:uncharacterized protein PG986_004103 [Apiospora aurea]|uniref:Ecp2 effector protein-like domain-containing protein n=1 Tax=Apiospora aurea TaxID=335848 RepID=A0ABR1QLM0_9PEZI